MSSRRLQDMSSRHLQDMSSRRLQDMSSRRLQDVFSVTIFRLPRRLEDVLEDVKLLHWRRVEDVFKTCLQRLQQMFAGWVLNTPLILSSNFIWHAYRLIAETKIFKLVVSLICFLYVKEVWIGKKVDYRKI